jgi:hypothetical protein
MSFLMRGHLANLNKCYLVFGVPIHRKIATLRLMRELLIA